MINNKRSKSAGNVEQSKIRVIPNKNIDNSPEKTKIKFNNFNNINKSKNRTGINFNNNNLESSFNDLALNTSRQMSDNDLLKLKTQ